jgi:hypothetical protein
VSVSSVCVTVSLDSAASPRDTVRTELRTGVGVSADWTRRRSRTAVRPATSASSDETRRYGARKNRRTAEPQCRVTG